MSIGATNFRTQSNYNPTQANQAQKTKQQAAFSGKLPSQQQVKEVIRGGIGSLPGLTLGAAGMGGLVTVMGAVITAASFTPVTVASVIVTALGFRKISQFSVALSKKGEKFMKNVHWN